MSSSFVLSYHQHGVVGSVDLLQTSTDELSALLADEKITSVDLVKAYLANIERNNIQGLGLRAIIQVAPLESVLHIARMLDEERRCGTIRSPLHGIPILVKDSIATAVELGMSTSAGNTALAQSVVPGDAEVIRRLRKAGAIILAKTNLTEFSNYKGKGVPNGWSAVGGQTSSPYVAGGYVRGGDLTGSSAGSAAGLSAGFGAIAIGAETAGSLVGPAGRAALYSIRPTNDLLPIEGVVPISSERDTVGPMCFTVADAAKVLDVLANGDGKYHQAARAPLLSGMRLGLVRQHFQDETEERYVRPGTDIEICSSSVLSAMETMRVAGADTMDVDMDLECSDIRSFFESEWLILAADFKEDMTAYLQHLKESPVRNVQELVQWNQEHAKEELPPHAPSQQILIDSATAPSKHSEAYRLARANSLNIGGAKGFDHIFDKYNLDAAVFAMDFGHSSFLAGLSGYASGTAPLGQYGNGTPFGLIFFVRPYHEEKLIRILAAYEAITPRRPSPRGL